MPAGTLLTLYSIILSCGKGSNSSSLVQEVSTKPRNRILKKVYVLFIVLFIFLSELRFSQSTIPFQTWYFLFSPVRNRKRNKVSRRSSSRCPDLICFCKCCAF